MLLLLFFSGALLAGELLGRLEVSEFLIEPTFIINDSRQAKLLLSNSYLAIDWNHIDGSRDNTNRDGGKNSSNLWSGHFVFGQKELLGVPTRFGNTTFTSTDFGFVEGYGEFRSDYGKIRFGLIPLEFGLEGGAFQGESLESKLVLQRSLIYQLRLVGLRDFGLFYSIRHGDFFTSLAVHNGESGEELDERLWYTANWGWGRKWSQTSWKLGVSATTGKTTPLSTAQVGNNSLISLFDNTANGFWRIGLFYINYKNRRWMTQASYYAGKVLQDIKDGSFSGGHVDVFYKIGSVWDVMFRYDVIDPDELTTNDHHQSLTTGFVWHNFYQTSRLFFEFVQNFEPQSKGVENRFLFRWRLSSRP